MGCKGSKQEQLVASPQSTAIVEPVKATSDPATPTAGRPVDMNTEDAMMLVREVARQVVAGAIAQVQVVLGRAPNPSDDHPATTVPEVKKELSGTVSAAPPTPPVVAPTSDNATLDAVKMEQISLSLDKAAVVEANAVQRGGFFCCSYDAK